MQKLDARYQSEIGPRLLELNKVQIRALDILDAAYQKKSYTHDEKQALKEIIVKEIEHLVNSGGMLPDLYDIFRRGQGLASGYD